MNAGVGVHVGCGEAITLIDLGEHGDIYTSLDILAINGQSIY